MERKKINEVVFSSMSAADKLKVVGQMTDADTREVQDATMVRILNECANKYGAFHINQDRRVGNKWDSEVEGLELADGRPYLNVYVQSTKTDTNVLVPFCKFTMDGTFHGRSNVGCYSYSARQKADVVRSILTEYVYWKHIEKDAREQREKVAKITHWTIVNVVYNEFYEKWRCGRNCREKETARYHRCKDAVEEYAAKHVNELFGKSDAELQDIYREVFNKTK